MSFSRSFKFILVAILFVSTLGLANNNYRRGPSGESYYNKAASHTPWMFPGISVASPAGFGAQWGNVGVGAGFQSRTRGGTNADGSIGAAFGAGDAEKYVGVETAVSILSVTGSDAFDRGSVSFKIHRRLPWGLSVAAGRESAIIWGGSDGGRSWYGSVSKVIILQDPSEWFSALTLTAGAGDGRFRMEKDVNAGNSNVMAFGSAALRLQEPVSFLVDWTGQDLALGLSITPLRDFGLYINPSLVDVTRTAGDGVRFLLGVGLGYTFT